jgi:carbonic anhydrase
MFSLFSSSRGRPRPRLRFVPAVEGLEERTVMNAVRPPGVDFLPVHAVVHHVHHGHGDPSISGVVTNGATHKPMVGVQIQLVTANDHLVAVQTTNAKGQYSFNVAATPTPYVVHALLPAGMLQKTPTFPSEEPTGSLVPGASGASWSYASLNTNPKNGPVGPQAWATIAPEGNSPFESPININVPPIDLSRYLTVNYNAVVPLQLINNGAQIQVQFPASPADTVTVGAPGTGNTPVTSYLTQFHYHLPSENTVSGAHYTMEEHFVNIAPNGAETVVAVFLKLGAFNSALESVLSAAAASLPVSGTKTTIAGAINFAGLLPSSKMGWYYQGSLTTPPLSRPVNWFVYAQPITLSPSQLSEYEFVASGGGFLPNARPLQQMDGRLVNGIDYDINYQGKSISNQNFVFVPKPEA